MGALYDARENAIRMLWEEWIADAWAPWAKDTNTFDSLNRMTRQIQYYDYGAGLEQDMNVLFTYGSGSPVYPSQIVYQGWDGLAWANLGRELWYYDSRGNDSAELMQNWNASGSGTWVNYARFFFSVDASGRPLETVQSFWNAGTAAYQNSMRITWTYTILQISGLRPHSFARPRGQAYRPLRSGAVLLFREKEGRMQAVDATGRLRAVPPRVD
jgi:hypothetical protein